MLKNPGLPITIYQIAWLSGCTFPKTFSMSNILASFRSTDIYTIDCNVFDQSEFLPASVTSRSLPINDNIDPEVTMSAKLLELLKAWGTVLNSSITSTNEDILSQKSPISKRQQLKRKKIGNRHKTTAAVLTNRREKDPFFYLTTTTCFVKTTYFSTTKGLSGVLKFCAKNVQFYNVV